MPANTISQPYVADMPGVLDAWRNRNRQQAQDARYERQVGLRERAFGLRERQYADERAQAAQVKQARGTATSAMMGGGNRQGRRDALSAFAALDPAGAQQLVDLVGGMDEQQREELGRKNEKIARDLIALKKAPEAQKPMLYRQTRKKYPDSNLPENFDPQLLDYHAMQSMSLDQVLRQMAQNKPSAGFRPAKGGGEEPIPGSKADPKYRRRLAEAERAPDKPSEFEKLLSAAGIKGDERNKLRRARAEDLAGLGGEDAKAQSAIGKLNADLEANRITPGQHKAATKKALNSEPPETIARSVLLPIYKKVRDNGTPTKGEQAVLDLAMKMDPIRGAIRNALGAAGLLSGPGPEGPAAESLTAGAPEFQMLNQAREAIRAGRNRSAVEQMLREKGVDPEGL